MERAIAMTRESQREGSGGLEGSYNFRRIDDQLTTSGVVGAQRLAALAESGVEVVIDLLPPDNQYALADEAELVRAQGVEYVNIPVAWEAPTAADYEAFCREMDGIGERRVHVHCAANWRVSAFWSLYALERGRCSAAEARSLVGGLWNPDEHPQWRALIDALGGSGRF